MANKRCSNCGKDMGEHQPYELKLELLDTCKACKKILERKKDKQIKDFLLTGKF